MGVAVDSRLGNGGGGGAAIHRAVRQREVGRVVSSVGIGHVSGGAVPAPVSHHDMVVAPTCKVLGAFGITTAGVARPWTVVTKCLAHVGIGLTEHAVCGRAVCGLEATHKAQKITAMGTLQRTHGVGVHGAAVNAGSIGRTTVVVQNLPGNTYFFVR